MEEGQKAIELDPDFAIGYENVAFAYVYLNRLPEAEALLRKASERKIEVIQFSLCRYFYRFSEERPGGNGKGNDPTAGKTGSPGMVRAPGSSDVGVSGAPERSKSAIGARSEPCSPGRFAGAGRPCFKALGPCGMRCFGNSRGGAKKRGGGVVALSEAGTPTMDLPLRWRFWTIPRKLTRSRRNSKSATRRTHLSNSVTCLRCGRSKRSTRDDPAKALEMTQAADSVRPRCSGLQLLYRRSFFGALYPVYVRGLAYSRMGRHREAAAEFQKILDHPGIMLNDPIGPMARLQLARALSASGDRAKSAAVYKDLLTLWKDADPDHSGRPRSQG